jgi:hypothetical protein
VQDNFTPLWKWRVAEEGKVSNGLEEGETGPREMSRLEMAKREFRRTHLFRQLILTIITLARDFQFKQAGAKI